MSPDHRGRASLSRLRRPITAVAALPLLLAPVTVALTATPAAAAPTNVALNKPATGSASCTTSETPAKAVNGSVSGGNTDKFCTLASSKYLQVDLGSAQSLSSFAVKHAGAGGESTAYNTKAFTIATSTDGSTWTTRVTVTGNTASTTTHPIAAVSARYVRLTIQTATQGTDPAARIYELEAYSDTTTPPPTGTCTGENTADVAIPDLATATSPIALSCAGNASASSTVEVHIKHTYVGDLVISLVAPDGTAYTLQSKVGGSQVNLDKTFTVDLSAEAATGTWTLKAQDTARDDAGTIDSWKLSTGAPAPTNTINVFDHLPQFGIYRSTEPTWTPPAGVLMWTKGTEFARKLTDAEKAKIGGDAALRLKYHGQCDPYDRFGSLFFISMAKGTAPTVSTPRVTLTDFITPFSDAWQGTKSNYTFPDAGMGAYASALTNPDRDIWIGISGGSNPGYGSDSCQTRNITDPDYIQVGFLYSLDIVSTTPVTAGDRDITSILSRYDIKTNTYTSPAFTNTAAGGTGKLAISIAGYGAANGGEEYSNTTVKLTALGRQIASFSTAVNCAEYEQYSPRGNPGIFRNNTTTNPRSWCPGALVAMRFFDLGDIRDKSVSVKVDIGRPAPFTADSSYRTSLAILEQ